MTQPLLVVDDDPLIADSLAYFLGREFAVGVAASREEAIAALREGPSPVVALIDLGLPPRPHRPDEGFALIGDILAHSPQTRIIVLSGQSDASHARHARALGATEFVAKPVDPEDLRQLIRRVLSFNDAPHGGNDGLIGMSPPMQRLRAQLRQFADSPFPVLIEGESGSGKELAAAALHRLSSRQGKPYLALNCSAISANLVEAALFGHGKGAFTGASGARAGYFEEAQDGTLFLDEIGELPLELQPKLLRVLENGEYQRIGETATRRAAARIVAATNRDLRREVKEGRFRADLYHRLSVFSVQMPSLRQLGHDRLVLLEHFLRLYAAQANSRLPELDEAAQARMRQYDFPGNVRELRNIAIRLTAKYPGRQVGPAEIELELDNQTGAATLANTPTESPAQRLPDGEDLVHMAIAELENTETFDLDERLRAIERAYIDAAQRITNGNVSQTARRLGINRSTLYNRLDSLSRPPEPK